MADVLNALGKAKKVTLPSGWIERFSKKHPDRPFYFNENTGESMWSIPLSEPEKDGSERKGKRKKQLDSEESDASSSAGDRLLSAINSNRLKLKAKRTKSAANDAEDSKIDTPAMQLYREKLAQRKVHKAKKNSSKTKKQNQTLMLSKAIAQASPSWVQQNQQRARMSSSVTSSTESISSKCSTISNASSMGSKIKQAAVPLTRTPVKLTNGLEHVAPNKLPKIPKVKLVENISVPSRINQSDNERFSDTSTVDFGDDKNEMNTSRRSSLTNNNNNNSSPPDKSKLFNSSTPILCRQVQNRLSSLENRVYNSGVLEINKAKQVKIYEEENVKDKRILEKVISADVYCEEMEWETIEEEKIMSEVRSVRFKLCEQPPETFNEISCNTLQSVDNSEGIHTLYIIIDTNVYLSNLPYVEEVRDSRSDIFGRPYIVVPWTVLQELDFIKDDKNHTRSPALILKARKAVDFLNQHFAIKHPRFLGQTPKEVEENKKKFITECPDDEILQTCLQIKECAKLPVLLSYDKNLCTKAMFHNIRVLGRDDPLDTFTLKPDDSTEFISNSLHAHIEEKPECLSIAQQEAEIVEEIMEEGKAILKFVLSEVVAKEMEVLFGDRWKMHVIIRPPWSVITVLKCALKHWMAAVSESFIRKTEPMLRDLLQYIYNIPKGGRKLSDAKFFLDKCNDVMQTLNNTKYPDFKPEILNKVDKLRQQCLEDIEKIDKARFQESVGCEDDEVEQERRATFAFQVLEDIYAFARDACGIASDALGLQCSFSYNKIHPFLTTKLALQRQSDVAINVKKLLDLIRQILFKEKHGMLRQHNDRYVLDLYHVLINFSSDLNFDELSRLDPLDLFCCIKLKKPKLEKGCEQLQELAIHFCRMANYQCTNNM